METKDSCFSTEKPENLDPDKSTSKSDSQYTNLNLNQNYQLLKNVTSKSITNHGGGKMSKDTDFINYDQNKFNQKSYGHEKSDKSLFTNEYLNHHNLQKEEYVTNESKKSTSNSTLTLHISAYKNGTVKNNLGNQYYFDLAKVQKSVEQRTKWKDVKYLFAKTTKQSFEFPRQQKEASKNEPEIMQFKASQKLQNLNQQKPQKNKYVEKSSETEEQNQRILNYCRILQLLSKCTGHFQKIFKQRWLKYQKSTEWEDTDANRIKLIQLCPTATPQMKESIKNDNLELWDITLFNHCIQALSNQIRNLGGTIDKKEDIVIGCIRETRNKVVHGKPELADDEFEKLFNDLSKFMIKLGETQTAMNELKIDLMKIGESKVEPKSENIKNEFKILKDKANKFFQVKNYNESINVYNEILQLPGLLSEQQALVFSNKSAAYLSLKTKEAYSLAKRHADLAIQLWPSWWRGYFRLGKAEDALGNLVEAKSAFEKALALNSGSNEVGDELSAVRSKLQSRLQQDHLNPALIPDCYEKEVEKDCQRMGISKEQYVKAADDINFINGQKWRLGFEGQQDFTKAFGYYVKSASNGNSYSMYQLGIMCRKGEGVDRNYKQAIKWLIKAAESKGRVLMGYGIAEAQHILGVMYYEGEGVQKDFRKAFEWYSKAVNNGCAAAANNLGKMYLYGQGVEQSAEKAFKYFKCASEGGDTAAMQNLAQAYFMGNGTPEGIPTPNNSSEGIKWLKVASEKGNVCAQQRLEEVEKMDFAELVNDSLEKISTITPKSEPLDQKQFKTQIRNAKEKGSITAKNLLEIWKQLNIATDAFTKKDSAKVVTALSKAIRIDHTIVKFQDFFKPLIKERFLSEPTDLDAITCYVNIMMTDKNALKLINEKLEIFPKDEYLLDMKVSAYLHLEDLKSALSASNKAIEFHPNCPRLMFGHAVVLFAQQPSSKDCLKFIDNFLAVAPVDHQKVPTCHYLKAEYFRRDLKNLSKFREFYEAGLSAEKKQLPCFLPFKCEVKEFLTTKYVIEGYFKTPSKIMNLVVPAKGQFSSHECLEKVKMNVRLNHLLIQHRQRFIEMHQKLEYISSPIKNTLPNASKPPEVLSLKKIMLKDMVGKEKIHDGKVLKVRVVDWSLPFLTPAVIIQDENGDIERLLICNFRMGGVFVKREIELLMKKFKPNVILSIINPYKREMAADMRSVIRVENPDCVIVDDSDADERCTCCGKKAKVLHCSGCKMSKYCSKECQKYDWIELEHKKVCKALQTYNIGMK